MIFEGYLDKIYYRFFNVNNSKAYIFTIHGLGGHCLWFDNGAKLFNKKNIGFFSFDLPGFGQSKYEKGEIKSYEDWISTSVNVLWEFLNKFEIKKPVFILGHSMGGLIAVCMTQKVVSHGWILSVPGFEGHKDSFPFLKFTVPVLLKSLFKPSDTVTMPFGPEILVKDREMQVEIKKDPYRVISPKASIYKHVFFLSQKAKKLCKKLKEPVLMLQASEDKVCSNEAMDICFENIGSKDKTKKVYENSCHDLFVEKALNQLVDDVSEWIEDRR